MKSTISLFDCQFTADQYCKAVNLHDFCLTALLVLEIDTEHAFTINHYYLYIHINLSNCFPLFSDDPTSPGCTFRPRWCDSSVTGLGCRRGTARLRRQQLSRPRHRPQQRVCVVCCLGASNHKYFIVYAIEYIFFPCEIYLIVSNQLVMDSHLTVVVSSGMLLQRSSSQNTGSKPSKTTPLIWTPTGMTRPWGNSSGKCRVWDCV